MATAHAARVANFVLPGMEVNDFSHLLMRRVSMRFGDKHFWRVPARIGILLAEASWFSTAIRGFGSGGNLTGTRIDTPEHPFTPMAFRGSSLTLTR